MASYTEHYKLKKPAPEDVIDIADLNENADKIEAALMGKAELEDVGTFLAGSETLAETMKAGDLLAVVWEANGAVDDAWSQDANTVKGTGAVCQVEGGALRLRVGSGNGNNSSAGADKPPAVFINESASQALAAISGAKFLELAFTPVSSPYDSRIGVYINYDGPGDGLFVGYDFQGWYWQVYQNGDADWYNGARKAAPERGVSTTLRLEWNGETLTSATLNGETLFQNVNFSAAAPFSNMGRVALRLGCLEATDTEILVTKMTYTGLEGME